VALIAQERESATFETLYVSGRFVRYVHIPKELDIGRYMEAVLSLRLRFVFHAFAFERSQ
jgi:hypothetical protein